MNKERIIQKLRHIKAFTEECITELSSKEILKKIPIRKLLKVQPIIPVKINFDMGERAFIKKHSKSISGPKKFVLILAYLVKGEIGKEKSLEEIKRHWNKMTSLLKGKFNPFYSVTAKDNSWVDSKKYAFYFLTSDWKEIFRKK